MNKQLINGIRQLVSVSEHDSIDSIVSQYIEQHYCEADITKTQFYPSQIASKYFCINKEVLRRILGNRVDKKEQSLIRIFDIGIVLHALWQNRYLGPARLLVGDWQCVCGFTTYGWMPRDICPTCGKKDLFKYSEPRLMYHLDENNVISGYADGIIMLRDEKIVLEMKTVSGSAFLKIKKPETWHIIQLNIAMGILHLVKGKLLYISKQDNLIKEFDILVFIVKV